MGIVKYGLPVSPNMAYGPIIRWLEHESVGISEENPIRNGVQAKECWEIAKEKVVQYLENLKLKVKSNTNSDEGDIFLAHQMILEDPVLEEKVLSKVCPGNLLSTAIQEACDELAATFEMIDNLYLRERAADIRDIKGHLIQAVTGKKVTGPPQFEEPGILMAIDLTPSQTAQLNPDLVLGLVLQKGSRTSHTAILARAWEIPAVVAIDNLFDIEREGQFILVDGDSGKVVINPDSTEMETYRTRPELKGKQPISPVSFNLTEVETSDGYPVEVVANIGSIRDLSQLAKYGVAGIGLCRTEVLFLESDHLPGEEEQFEWYRKVLMAASPHEVVFRTLDAGGDKVIPSLQLPREENPFLGLRAIRLCLEHREIFKNQLRALLRASVHGSMKVMFPMIATIEEFRQAMALAMEVRSELDQSGQSYASVQWGIMIEIPAAAVLADQLAKEVDFFSIGTNDLIQYSMAADRLNEQVRYLYQPLHPAILRLIGQVVTGASIRGRKVGVCGEMAGTLEAIPLLIGLGVNELSMSPMMVPKAKELIASLSRNETVKMAETALQCLTSDEVYALLLRR